MKTIGLIGGMSWESSIEYYRIINETVRDYLGGFHSAKSIMVSVDFAEIEALQSKGDWELATQIMVKTAQQVENGGADFVLICTNTMHKMADSVQASIHIPLIHIAVATGEQIIENGFTSIGLLGTRFTMEEEFYRGKLEKNFGLNVLIPEKEEREIIDKIIYNELVLGNIQDSSRMSYLEIINKLVDRGAQGIILGCTEIGLLVKQEYCTVKLFDTTYIHAVAAVNYSLNS